MTPVATLDLPTNPYSIRLTLDGSIVLRYKDERKTEVYCVQSLPSPRIKLYMTFPTGSKLRETAHNQWVSLEDEHVLVWTRFSDEPLRHTPRQFGLIYSIRAHPLTEWILLHSFHGTLVAFHLSTKAQVTLAKEQLTCIYSFQPDTKGRATCIYRVFGNLRIWREGQLLSHSAPRSLTRSIHWYYVPYRFSTASGLVLLTHQTHYLDVNVFQDKKVTRLDNLTTMDTTKTLDSKRFVCLKQQGDPLLPQIPEIRSLTHPDGPGEPLSIHFPDNAPRRDILFSPSGWAVSKQFKCNYETKMVTHDLNVQIVTHDLNVPMLVIYADDKLQSQDARAAKHLLHDYAWLMLLDLRQIITDYLAGPILEQMDGRNKEGKGEEEATSSRFK